MAAIQDWVLEYVKTLIKALQEEFGERLLYVGLQGSHLRKEAERNSDIDIMAVLDALNPEDLDAYRRVVKALDYADRSCGFLCGKRELANWNSCEICHLIHTTKDCFGRLAELVPEYTEADVLAYIRIMTGNLYHALCHSRVHGFVPGEGAEMVPKERRNSAQADWERRLPGAFKEAFFILQNKQYLESGIFAVSRAELAGLLSGTDAKVLKETVAAKDFPAEKADGEAEKSNSASERRFVLLFDWCKQTLAWAAEKERI